MGSLQLMVSKAKFIWVPHKQPNFVVRNGSYFCTCELQRLTVCS